MALVIALSVLLAAVVAAAVTWLVAGAVRGPATSASSVSDDVYAAVEDAMAAVRMEAAAERDAAVQAALQQVAVLNREQLGSAASGVQADLAAKKDVIDTRLDEVRGEVRAELLRLGALVSELGTASAQRFGQVDESLRAHAEITATLTTTTGALREALANPQVRGQWGERMAEDVLRLAGFTEHVNYRKQTQVDGGTGRPDFTFDMPKGHVLYMDVKFPLAAYMRFLDAGNEAERAAHREQFLRDVRLRVKELADRDYARAGTRPAVDYVLLFLPNETLSGFIHENDPTLVEHALQQKVVLCSPLTLFAFLGVVRQAFDNFMIEQTSDEILRLMGAFSKQWGEYTKSIDTVKRRMEQVQRELDNLAGTRRRQLERPLGQLEALRRDRGLAIDGELFDADVLELEGYRDDVGA